MLSILKKKHFWGAIIGIALLVWCAKDVKWQDLETLATRTNFWYLFPATGCAFVFVILKALRWRVLVEPQKDIPLVRAITLYSTGQVLNIAMPALTGQVGRLILFSRKEGLRKTFIFSTILLEILFDAISLVVLILITSLVIVFPSEYRFIGFVIAGVTVLVLILFYLTLHFESSLESAARRHIRSRWPGVYVTLTKFLRSFTKGIQMLRSTSHFSQTLGISFALWAAHLLVIQFLFKSFGFDLTVAVAAAIMIINTIILMVPITPGNAGTFEVTVSTSLKAFSVGSTDAVLFALALHIFDVVPAFIFGFWYLKVEKISLAQIREEEAQTAILTELESEAQVGPKPKQ
jgi:glycosyltransferase 2 family protein